MSNGLAEHIRGIRRAIDHRGDSRNVVLVGAQLALHVFLLFVLPGLVTRNGWWAIALALAAIVPIPMWILAHEAVHGGLHRRRAVNDLLGQLLASVCYGAPFELMRIGHLLHHKDNAYGQSRIEPGGSRSWRWYAKYYGGLFLQPVAPLLLSNLMALLPVRWARPVARWFAAPGLITRATEPRAYARIRWEGLTTLALFALSAYCWRAHPMGLVLIVALRCALISIDDSVYHFQGPVDPQHGYNLRVPTVLGWLFLDFNHHGIHHLNAGLRWRQLAPTFGRAGLRYDGSYIAVALAQLRPMSPLILELPTASSPPAPTEPA